MPEPGYFLLALYQICTPWGSCSGHERCGVDVLMCWCVQVIRDKKTKKSKGFGIVSLLDGGDYAKVSHPAAAALHQLPVLADIKVFGHQA